MDKYEIENVAWYQSMSLTDEEVVNHLFIKSLPPEKQKEDIPSLRLYLRDFFYNELYQDLKVAGRFVKEPEHRL